MNKEGQNAKDFSIQELSRAIDSEIEKFEAEREEESEVDPVSAKIQALKKKHHLLELQDNCDKSETRKTSKLNEVQSAAESDGILLTKTEKHLEHTKEVSSVYQLSNQAIANNNSSQRRIAWLPIVFLAQSLL